ncbi:Nn.00g114830.m01.CDS01 [Neocucurbitaria sp. VM-36]
MNLRSRTYILFFIVATALATFDSGSKANLAIYWGQNSAGGSNGQNQTRLSTYCADTNIDIVLLAFLVAVNDAGGQPKLNFANQGYNCTGSTSPTICQEIEADIKDCQEKKKTVLLSMGGAIATEERGYNDEPAAKDGAKKMWDMFGPNGAKGIFRPFGSASVDGFDLAFEKDVSNIIPFGKELRTLMDNYEKEQGGRQFYLSAAPTCNKPNSSTIINEIPLDMAFVQFYNDDTCGKKGGYNFDEWNTWARAKNTTFFMGLPAKEVAAKSESYVPPGQLNEVLQNAGTNDRMRGAMLWDASQAWSNDNYHHKVKSSLNALPKVGQRSMRNNRQFPRAAVSLL